MAQLKRVNWLTAGKVEVAIVFMQMLGIEEAMLYMETHGIPQHVADRVLRSATTIRISDGMIAWNCQDRPETGSAESADPAISCPAAQAPLSIAP